MTVASIGIRSNNVIVPYVSTTKRTKEMDFTTTGLITAGGTNTNSWGTLRAVAVAYADSTGKWRLNFNISGLCVSTGVHTGYVITFSSTAAVVFKNTTSFFQPVTPYLALNNNVGVAYVNPNTADICINHASYGETYYAVSGDVELESEPTWAAANMEGVIAADVYIAPASGATPGIVDNLAQHFHGVKDFGDGIKLATGTTLNVCESGSFTFYLHDAVNAPINIGLIYYTRVGALVTLYIPDSYTNTATANRILSSSPTLGSYQLPAVIKPTRSQYCPVRVIDNTIQTAPGLAKIDSADADQIAIYVTLAEVHFDTDAVNKGIVASTISYLVN